MPYVTLDSVTALYYEEDCHADPWDLDVEVVLMLHGMGESSASWFAWIPYFSRRYRVIRVDLRGLGKSTVPEPGYPWSPQNHAADIDTFLRGLNIPRVHLIGAKFGATISLALAALYPGIVSSVTVLGPMIRADNSEYIIEDLANRESAQTHAQVVQHYENTVANRLGTNANPAQARWLVELQSQSNIRVLAEVREALKGVDLTPLLPLIQAPCLVLVARDGKLQPVGEMKNWVKSIPRGEIAVWPGDGYHLAAAHPDACARRVLEHVQGNSLYKARIDEISADFE